MRAASRIRGLVLLCSEELHAARQKTLVAAVTALVHCGRVVCASMGRAVATATSDKHGIKRMDRLLGSTTLHRERMAIYRKLAEHTVGRISRPIVLVDWSQLGRDKCILKAVLALQGRGVPLYAESHTLSANAKPSVHKQFLLRLQSILPADCCPVIVTDSGFKHPWCAAVRALGWDYVTRVRGKNCVRADAQGEWFTAKDCAELFGTGLHDMREGELNRHGPVPTRLVLWDGRSKRARKRPTEKGRRIRVRRAVRGAHEPWLLSTSLAEGLARDIVEIYGLRMQIELSLRDDKSHWLGWGLQQARTRRCARVDIQLLLIAIGTVAALLVGMAAEQAQLVRHFQANTERRRRVLSLFALGRRVLTSRALECIPADQIARMLAALRDMVPRFAGFYGLE